MKKIIKSALIFLLFIIGGLVSKSQTPSDFLKKSEAQYYKYSKEIQKDLNTKLQNEKQVDSFYRAFIPKFEAAAELFGTMSSYMMLNTKLPKNQKDKLMLSTVDDYQTLADNINKRKLQLSSDFPNINYNSIFTENLKDKVYKLIMRGIDEAEQLENINNNKKLSLAAKQEQALIQYSKYLFKSEYAKGLVKGFDSDKKLSDLLKPLIEIEGQIDELFRKIVPEKK